MKLELFNPKTHGSEQNSAYEGECVVNSAIALTDIEYDDELFVHTNHRRNPGDCPRLSQLQAQPSKPAILGFASKQFLKVICPERTSHTIGVIAHPICRQRLHGETIPTDVDGVRKIECPFMYLTGKVKGAIGEALVVVDAMDKKRQ